MEPVPIVEVSPMVPIPIPVVSVIIGSTVVAVSVVAPPSELLLPQAVSTPAIAAIARNFFICCFFEVYNS
jgi:hypothetical protein